jgi:flagellar motility protein MotE (MotC chaperone)
MKPEDNSNLSSVFESYNKSLLEKLNEQTKATNKVYDELKKFNERIDKDKQEQEQLEKKKQDENQEKKQDSDEILEELKNLSKLTEENGKQTETDEKIAKIVTKVEKDYDLYHMRRQMSLLLRSDCHSWSPFIFLYKPFTKTICILKTCLWVKTLNYT